MLQRDELGCAENKPLQYQGQIYENVQEEKRDYCEGAEGILVWFGLVFFLNIATNHRQNFAHLNPCFLLSSLLTCTYMCTALQTPYLGRNNPCHVRCGSSRACSLVLSACTRSSPSATQRAGSWGATAMLRSCCCAPDWDGRPGWLCD